MRHFLTLSFLIIFSPMAMAQSAGFWQAQPLDAAQRQARDIRPARPWAAQLDTGAMRAFLAGSLQGTLLDMPRADKVVDLPLPDGSFLAFRFLETPLMEAALAARYPYIRTYTGVAVRDARIRVKFDLTPAGFHAMVQGLAQGDAFIDPLQRGNSVDHQAYWKSDLPGPGARTCGYLDVNDLDEQGALSRQWLEELGSARAGDCQFRTYRLALACTGEYAAFFGATAGNKAPAIAAMATTMARVNGIYERDAALTMVLVANNDQLVFTNAATDGYTNDDGGTMLGENMAKCNAVIGSDNYDIGHVFSTGGGGVAYLNSPCTNFKAGGVTGLGSPVGDPFDVDYVAHEMGHQYGGNHSQNNNCNRAFPASVEVGSGITIMGYAGVCAPNVAPHSIAMLGGYSLEEIHANITAGSSSSCPITVPLVNAPPTVDGGPDRIIPRGTPFVLTAEATDPDAGDLPTFSWEQMNAQASTQPPSANSSQGPNFRPWLPTPDPQRWFPRLPVVASGISPSPNWEVLSNVARTYTFRVTVRDNAPGGGCNAQDDVTITVNGTAGPFRVTQPNTALTWAGGSTQTVLWDVAGTSAAPVACSLVDILLSTDGGLTWPHTLATAVPNNGSATVTAPALATTTARVMVRANGNVFYDMGNQNFTITAIPVNVSAKVFLEGPFAGAGMMADDLRQNGLVPTHEPYTALGFPQSGNGGGESCAPAVLAAGGTDAIVDWVRLELRAAGDAAQVVASRQALLQRDGDVVDVDGTSPVTFAASAGNYFVAVRHRNHLGCMTANAVALGETAASVDFTSASTAMYGTEARKQEGSAMVLWMGNIHADQVLKYTGPDNDRDPIVVAIGGTPTSTVGGYHQEDANLDGEVRYTGADNDRDPILVNLGAAAPTSIRQEQLP